MIIDFSTDSSDASGLIPEQRILAKPGPLVSGHSVKCFKGKRGNS